MELSPRKERILAAVVENYIKTGEPVGSKSIMALLSVSSATIRNEMAELSALGLLEQPHTSAGRIPTNEGYRYYVDNLMSVRHLDESVKHRIEAGVSVKNASPETILAKASEFLADLTECAAVSTTPLGENATVKRVELVPVGTRTVMIILLTSTGMIKSKVCRSDYDLSASVIEKFYNIVKTTFIGMTLDDIDMATLQTLVASMGSDALMMIPFVSTLSELAQDAMKTMIMLGGQSNILRYRDEYGSTAYELMEFLRRGEPICRMLSESKEAVDVTIGGENKFKQLENSSVITAQYTIDGDKRGSIGIIGPTRIDYASLIPSVRYLTDLVGNLLTQTLKED